MLFRPFDSDKAKNVITSYHTMLASAERVHNFLGEFEKEIINVSNSLVVDEVMETLNGMSVEALFDGKMYKRVEYLKEAGFNSVGDVFKASNYSIQQVPGLKYEAFDLKEKVDEMVNNIKQYTKIGRISSDRRTVGTTKLVCALAKYKECRELLDGMMSKLVEYRRDIETNIEEVKPYMGIGKCLFMSSAKKQVVADSFAKLCNSINGEFGKAVDSFVYSGNRITNMSGAEAWDCFNENSIKLFNILEDFNPGVMGSADANGSNDGSVYNLPANMVEEVKNQCFFPDGLKCELRPYQEWGVKYILHQEKVLLGDEMGLGKTVQAIATMVSLRNTGATHFVVVCPASVLTNWCREISEKSLLNVVMVHGTGRAAALKNWIKNGGVAVTTYETTKYFKFQDDFHFSTIIVDEAHYIKNSSAQRSINTTALAKRAERMLFMTGTALENHPNEMVELIRLLQPAVANQVENLTYMASAPQFREMVAPVYYRRKRSDVLAELPELIVNKDWVRLTSEEEKVYESAILEKKCMDARRVSFSAPAAVSAKCKRLMELVDEAKADGRKAIVFTYFTTTKNRVASILGDRCVGIIDGRTPIIRRQQIIDSLEKAPAGSVLVSQIQAGGTGLNIQSASMVIICEPQVKPSMETQAISRAYRMGQTRDVLVHKLLAANTIDERMLARLEEKQSLFDSFADKSVAAEKMENIQITEKGMNEIIQEEIERINEKNKMKVAA